MKTEKNIAYNYVVLKELYKYKVSFYFILNVTLIIKETQIFRQTFEEVNLLRNS